MSNVIKINDLPKLIGSPLPTDYLIIQDDTGTYKITVNDLLTKWDEVQVSSEGNDPITSIESSNPGINVFRDGNRVVLSNNGVLSLSAGDGISLDFSTGNIKITSLGALNNTTGFSNNGLPRNAGAYDYNLLVSRNQKHIIFSGNTNSVGLSQVRTGSSAFYPVNPAGNTYTYRDYKWDYVYNGYQYWAGITTERRIFLGGNWSFGDGKGSTNNYFYFDIANSLSQIELGFIPKHIMLPFHTRGNSATMFITSNNNDLYGFGHNSYGWLGTGDTTPKRSVTACNLSNVNYAISKGSTVLALLNNGQVKAIGSGSNGEMGDGGKASVNPIWHSVQNDISKTTLTNIVQIAIEGANVGSTCFALDAAGILYGWGANTYSQLGNNSTLELTRATQIAVNVGAVYTGGGEFPSTFYKTSDSYELYACGYNGYGQLGNSLTDGTTKLFTKVFDAREYDSTIKTVVCGGTNKFTTALLLLDNGRLFAAGYMPGTQGIGDHKGWIEVNPPFNTMSGNKIVDVASNGFGNEYTLLALNSDGTIAVIGFNRAFKLGPVVLPGEWAPFWSVIK